MISLIDIKRFFKGRIRLGEPVAPLTTLRIGGPADYLLEPVNESEQLELLRYLDEVGFPHAIIEPEMLVHDAGFRGVMINAGLGSVHASEQKVEMFRPAAGISVEELIRRIDMDGRTWGDAVVDGRFIRNGGNARAVDVLALVTHVQRTVLRITGLHLPIGFPVVGFREHVAKVA